MTVCPDCHKLLKGHGKRAISHHRQTGCSKQMLPPFRRPESRTKSSVNVSRKRNASIGADGTTTYHHDSSAYYTVPSIFEEANNIHINAEMDVDVDMLPLETFQDTISNPSDNDTLPDIADAVLPGPIPTIRPTRHRYAPARFRDLDMIPDKEITDLRVFADLYPTNFHHPVSSPSPPSSPKPARQPQVTFSSPNPFGLFYEYKVWSTPSAENFEPDPHETPSTSDASSRLPSFFPFSTHTAARIMEFFLRSFSTKREKVNAFAHQVMGDPETSIDEARNFSYDRERRLLDTHIQSQPDDWIGSSISISLPGCRSEPISTSSKRKRPAQSENKAPKVEIPGLLHRDLFEVITAAVKDKNSRLFHWRGYKLWWKPTQGKSAERVYGEVYTSDAFLRMEDSVNATAPQDGIENVVVPLLLYSDGTHPTLFGSAYLWPVYGWIGLLSKYVRSKPSSQSGLHIAYFPQLPDSVKDAFHNLSNTALSSPIWRFLRRDLFHTAWTTILNTGDFLKAYLYGKIVICFDGRQRRLFPRFYVYSADYPERTLIAGIKYLGNYLCCLCGIHTKDVYKLGTAEDDVLRSNVRVDSKARRGLIEKARKFIFRDGAGVESDKVNRLLNESMLPVRNAFSTALGDHGFNFYQMFPPDLMHGHELGVGKNLFLHLTRMVSTMGKDSLQILNARYRQISAFGKDGIRRFPSDVSAMQRPAAHNYEDTLQCAIPPFEQLFPEEDDDYIQDLLFTNGTWHALGKLRMHTDSTLDMLKVVTSSFGSQLRHFQKKVCPHFHTTQTPGEIARKERARAAINEKRAEEGLDPIQPRLNPQAEVFFNLSTSKIHDLGHYVDYIHEFGTTDSYSTQNGELLHKDPKRFYRATNKNVGFEKQIAGNERRENETRQVRERMAGDEDEDDLKDVLFDPVKTYQISSSRNEPVNLTRFLNQKDPALLNFLPDLQDHILSQLVGTPGESFTMQERNQLVFENNRIFQHRTLRINYTSYDVQREQWDTINPRTRSDIMVLACDDELELHPYWYARVIGIFHATVKQLGDDEWTDVDFLWVRWYGLDYQAPGGFKAKRLYQIGFLNANQDLGAFGFIDPRDVIRACHLIPRFADGQTSSLLSSSIARRPNEADLDYERYYINLFADRDMFMRYTGFGVGHRSTYSATQLLREDFSGAFLIEESDSEMETEEMVEDELGENNENDDWLLDYVFSDDEDDEYIDNYL